MKDSRFNANTNKANNSTTGNIGAIFAVAILVAVALFFGFPWLAGDSATVNNNIDAVQCAVTASC